MVYAKEIQLRNFKSFSGTVKLKLTPGFTVITGPNGSGKSNTLDAIQFVLGELGSRRMRVSSLSGLIYDGSEEKKTDYAQVIIKLDNSDRVIAIDRSVISIGRRVDREGRSKYFLNGKSVSRKTIVDILKMAGISSEGYNIVLQGTATRLSDITPTERMHSISTLIGITEYDAKKAEAKKKLDEAERKVEVASARIDEVRKRLVALEQERNDALRYQFLQREEKRLRIRKLSYEILEIESEIDRLNQKLNVNNEELQRLEIERKGLLSERIKAKDELEHFNQETAEKGNTRLPLIKSEIVRQRELIGALKRRNEEIERGRKALLKNMEDWSRESEQLRGERDEIDRMIDSLSGESSSLEGEIKEKESTRFGISERISLIREEVEKNQKRIEELEEKLGQTKEILNGYEIEINKHSLSVENLRGRLKDLLDKRIEYEKSVENLKNRLKDFEELKGVEEENLQDFLTDLNDRLERQKVLRKRAEEANSLVSDVEKAIIEFTAKRDLWGDISLEEKALQRIEEMGAAGAINGYQGILRDLISVASKYRQAVTASSDGWVNAIVVEDLSSALQCIKSLKKSELGMVRVLPLQDIRPLDVHEGVKDGGVIDSIPGLIKCKEELSPLISLIWGDTFLVKDDENALRIAGRGYRAVTLSGDVYEPSGGVIGGHYRSLSEFFNLVPSDGAVKNLSQTIKALKTHLNKRMKDLRLSGDDMRKMSRHIDDSTKSIEVIEGNISQTMELIKRTEKRIEALDKNMEEIQKEVETEESLITSQREKRERALQEIGEFKEEISRLSAIKPSDVANLEAQAARLDQELEALRIRGGELDQEKLKFKGRLEHIVEPRLSELEKRSSSAGESIETLEAESLKVKGDLEDAERLLREMEEERGVLTEAVESTTRVVRIHQETIREIESKIEELEGRTDSLKQGGNGLALDAERRRLRAEQLQRELIGLGQPEPIPLKKGEVEDSDKMMRVIRSEMETSGAINQLAVEQYDEQMRNYKQLSIRINELEEEKLSILKFIEEVEEEKLKHFMKSFNEICENFTEFFSKLTGGGDGRLEFQNPEDPFSAGIDLYIQFPGKPMRLASGHSGGERSVAAIAYLLAIQKFLKAPFYFFDEIDAHLDDLNVERLADVLRENSSEAQFLVITLKDAMLNRAERVYGCFSRGGKSKVISLPKIEVVS